MRAIIRRPVGRHFTSNVSATSEFCFQLELLKSSFFIARCFGPLSVVSDRPIFNTISTCNIHIYYNKNNLSYLLLLLFFHHLFYLLPITILLPPHRPRPPALPPHTPETAATGHRCSAARTHTHTHSE